MTNEVWFSSRLRFAIIIEIRGLVRYSDSLYLFQSGDFETALKKALEIGHRNEQSYLNGDGQRVVWKIAEVVLPGHYTDSVTRGSGNLFGVCSRNQLVSDGRT